MPFNSKELLKDINGNPVPQQFDTASDSYKVLTNKQLFGKSTDTKPTNVEIGTSFLEIDTKIVYVFDGTSWIDLKMGYSDEYNELDTKIGILKNPYNYVSEFPKQGAETDDTARFQRAIDDSISKGKTLILNEEVLISNEVKITNQLTMDGISWRTGGITLTTAQACLTLTDNGVNSHVFEVELRNIEIKGQNIANYCLRLINTSQIKIDNVYADRALIANIEIQNSSILYFNRVYSYYSPKAFLFDGINNTNFFQCNFWDNAVVFYAKNAVTDLVFTDTWHEKYTELVKVDNTVVTTLQMFSKGCHYLDTESPSMVFLRSNETTSDKSVTMIFEHCRIHLPTITATNLFEVTTIANNSLIKIDISNSYLFLPTAFTTLVNTTNVNSRAHMHIAYHKNRSKDIEIATDYNKAIVMGAVTKYNGEQIYYSNFVLPKYVSTSDASATVGTIKYDTSLNVPMIRDDSGGFNVFSIVKRGTTAQRPTSGLFTAYQYYDTTLGKPIWYNGSAWKDSAGTTV